jgi:hypothetical protein
MKRLFFAVSFILAVALAGCGGGSAPGSKGGSAPGQPLDPQGNWLFTLTAGSKTINLAGQLYELNPPTVTSNGLGAVDPAGTLCFGHFNASGQASGTNGIAFTVQQSDASGVNVAMSFTGTVADDQAHMSGTWSLTGSTSPCVTTASGTWSAQLLTPVTGNWSGSVTLGSNETITVTSTLTEVTDQTAANMGQVTGTITVSGAPCYDAPVTFTIPPWSDAAPKGSHAGEVLLIRPTPSNSLGLDILGHVTPDALTYTVDTFKVIGGVCDTQQFSGTLTRG